MQQLQSRLWTLVSLVSLLCQQWSHRLLAHKQLMSAMMLFAMIMMVGVTLHTGAPNEPGPFPWP